MSWLLKSPEHQQHAWYCGVKDRQHALFFQSKSNLLELSKIEDTIHIMNIYFIIFKSIDQLSMLRVNQRTDNADGQMPIFCGGEGVWVGVWGVGERHVQVLPFL